MAGRGKTGGARGGRGDGNKKLSYSTLITFDDLINEGLVDKVYYWATIRKSQDMYEANPHVRQDNMVRLVRHYVINHDNPDSALEKLLQSPGFSTFFRSIYGERQQKYFNEHLMRYINTLRIDCPFEITTTNRFTVHKLEASVTARQNIRQGQKIKYLRGIQVDLTPGEELELKRMKRDFSVVISARTGKPSIFLGPARFCNHDCEANANLDSCSDNAMEVVALKDIPIGEEITVRYSAHYFDDDNSKCLCMTCENLLDKGFSQYDDGGQRVLPPTIEEDLVMGPDGKPKRTLRERRIGKDYKERPPTPEPTGRKRRPRAPSLVELPGLSEKFIRDEPEALSERALAAKDKTPTPPPPLKKRVRRKVLPPHPNPEFHGIHSIYEYVRGTWWTEPGLTDEESGAEEEEEAQEDDSVVDFLAASVDAKVLERLQDTLEQDSVRDDGEELGGCLAVGYGIITIKQSTPATSVDPADYMDTSPPSTPKALRGATSSARCHNPLRATLALPGSPTSVSSKIPVVPMMAPRTAKGDGLKHNVSQMSSGIPLAPSKAVESESESDKPIPRPGANASAPMDLTSDSDDYVIPPRPLTEFTNDEESSAVEEDHEEPDTGLLNTVRRALGPGTKIMQPRTKKGQPRPREVPAQNFYNNCRKGIMMVLPTATPDKSPPKVQQEVPSTLKRRLMTTPQRVALREHDENKGLGGSLKTIDEGAEADSESDDTATETPSRKRAKRQHTNTLSHVDFKQVEEPPKPDEASPKQKAEPEPEEQLNEQEEKPAQRIPGDYLVAEELLRSQGDAWVQCNFCEEFYVQENAIQQDIKEIYCQRCVRHAKLFGVCWPRTTPVDGEQRREPEDWLKVLKGGKWDGLEQEYKRVSRRRQLIDRALKKQQERHGSQAEVDAQLLKDEDTNKTKEDGTHVKLAEIDKETEVEADELSDDDLDNRQVGVDDSVLAAPVEADPERPRPRQRTIKCPLCHVVRLRKGNRRQWLGNEMRYICFVCVKNAEAEICASAGVDRDGRSVPNEVVDANWRGNVDTAVLDELSDVAPVGTEQIDGDEEDEAPVVQDSDLDSDASVLYRGPPDQWMSRQAAAVGYKTKIRSCRWARGQDLQRCWCGVREMVDKEGVPERCDLSLSGRESLLQFSHEGWAAGMLAPLMNGAGADRARDLIREIFQTAAITQDEVDDCFNAIPCVASLDLITRELTSNIEDCGWENQFGCECRLLNRIREEATEERCDLSRFGTTTLKKVLHDEIYRSDAVELLKTEALEETAHIFASALRTYCDDEYTYDKCFDGEHPPFDPFLIPGCDEPISLTNFDDSHDDQDDDDNNDDDANDSGSTPRDQSPRNGTRPPTNSVLDDDSSSLFSTSSGSITFLGEKRVDGTVANPQTIQSQLRLANPSSGAAFDPPPGFDELADEEPKVTRVAKAMLRMEKGSLKQYEAYMRPIGEAPGIGKTPDDPIPLDEPPVGSPWAAFDASLPVADMGGDPSTSAHSSLGALNDLDALMRADGTPKSAREVMNAWKGKCKENRPLSQQRSSPAQGEERDEMLLDHKSHFDTPEGSTPSTGTSTPNGPRRIRRNRMGGRGPQFAV